MKTRRSHGFRALGAAALFAVLPASRGERDAAEASTDTPDLAVRLQVLDARRAQLGPLRLALRHVRTSALLLRPLERSGHLYYDPGYGMVLVYDPPDPFAVIVREGRVRRVTAAGAEEGADLRARPVFAGLTRLVAHDFSALPAYFRVAVASDSRADAWKLVLAPRREGAVRTIALTIDPQTAVVRRIEIDEGGGNGHDMLFSEEDAPAAPASWFTPGYWREAFESVPPAPGTGSAAP